MKEHQTEPESSVVIRFQDCDPLGHLNNSKYIDYMMNAREDHLIHSYGINVFAMAQEQGITWVVGKNEIAYLKPAFVMEKVLIQTRLIDFAERFVQAEMVMYDFHKTHVKAVMWSKFVHFDVKTQRSRVHANRHMELFKTINLPTPSPTIEERSRQLIEELQSGAVPVKAI